jgi:predicted dienelactone hydrolase
MRTLVWLSLGLLLILAPPTRADYDPLQIPTGKVETIDLTVSDTARKRELPLRVYLPSGTTPAPVVVFSHGLGGACTNNPYLGNHWAARGYVVVFMQHPGSDEHVWKDVPAAQRLAAMNKAASTENFVARVKDVPVLLDQLAKWHSTTGHPFAGRLNLDQIGMSGHSFGAVTTQAVSGQSFPLGISYTDARIKAALAMSPSGARKGGDGAAAFGKVKIPWLLMTGTHDTSIIAKDIDVKSRLSVFPALPVGGKYELVLHQAEHSAFGDRALPGDKEQRNPNHHRAILATSTAFWDAHLRNDPAAKQWLDGPAVRQVLEMADTWQKK